MRKESKLLKTLKERGIQFYLFNQQRRKEMIEIHCSHCGVYLPTDKQLEDLFFRTILQGYQCYRCNEEIKIFIKGELATLPVIRDYIHRLL
jgi:hypothetical protein